MPGHPLFPIASKIFRGCRASLLHQTLNLEDLVRVQASAERSMWCIGSTLSGLFDNCPYKNSRADGSRLLRPTKPPKRKVRRTFLYRESERVEREVLVVTRRRKPEKEVRLLPNRHGLGRNCPHNIRALTSGVTSEPGLEARHGESRGQVAA